MYILQEHEPITFQTRVKGFALSEGFAPPLAPVAQKSAKPTLREVVDLAKRFSRLALRPSFHRKRETLTGMPDSGQNPSAIHSVMERFRLRRLIPPLMRT